MAGSCRWYQGQPNRGQEIGKRLEGACVEFDGVTELITVRRGIEHPQRHLEGVAIRMFNGRPFATRLAPADDPQLMTVQRMESIVHRHRRRHGI